MTEVEPRRPLLGRIRRALPGNRTGTISSVARNVDSTATYGHEGVDTEVPGDRDSAGKRRP